MESFSKDWIVWKRTIFDRKESNVLSMKSANQTLCEVFAQPLVLRNLNKRSAASDRRSCLFNRAPGVARWQIPFNTTHCLCPRRETTIRNVSNIRHGDVKPKIHENAKSSLIKNSG